MIKDEEFAFAIKNNSMFTWIRFYRKKKLLPLKKGGGFALAKTEGLGEGD